MQQPMSVLCIPEPPFPISRKIGFKDMLTVRPFLAKGLIGGKHRYSPFSKPTYAADHPPSTAMKCGASLPANRQNGTRILLAAAGGAAGG